nr:protein insensitive-like isoform X1 [Bactrocera oleae]
MDFLLPILSEDQLAAEIALLNKATKPEEIQKLVDSWLNKYLPQLEPCELNPVVQDILRTKSTLSEKMHHLSRVYRRLKQQQRIIALSTVLSKRATNQLISSTSDLYTTHGRSSTSSFNFTASPVCSNAKQNTRCDSNYRADPRKRVLWEMRQETVNQSEISTETQSGNNVKPMDASVKAQMNAVSENNTYNVANSSTIKNVAIGGVEAQSIRGMDGTTMQMPILINDIGSTNRMENNLASSTSTSPPVTTTTISENIINNVVDSSNIRNVVNDGEEIQSISTMEGIESVAAYETVATSTESGISISNTVDTDRATSTSTPTLASSPFVTSSTPMQIPILINDIGISSAAENDRAASTGTPTPISPPRASSTPMRGPHLPTIDNGVYTVIGPNGTKVPTRKFQTISFEAPSTATRILLCLVFSEEILAKNTLSGKPSPAFVGRERPPKGQLNPDKVSDIIHCVKLHTPFTEKSIRSIITTKCADSTKKLRRLSKT